MVQLGKEIKGCRKRKNNIHGQRIETSVKFTALRYCCCSVPKLGLALCDPMDCSPPGSSILLYSPDFPQIHVHWVSDAIQLSHPLSVPSPLILILSQHQGLFQWIGSLYQLAKVVELQLHHQSFQWIFRVNFLYIDLFDPLSTQGTLKSLLQHHSSKASILRRSAFFWSNSHICTWLLEIP